MTNCAVTGAPKLSEKGAARSNSSSVNARTASAASRLLRRRSSSAVVFVSSACSCACLAFNWATASHVTSVTAFPVAIVVEDNNLDYCISQLRKLFHPEKYIETVPRHGYRFVAPIRNIVSASSRAVPAGGQPITPLPRQDVGFRLRRMVCVLPGRALETDRLW
jgi:hypothetical protein